MQNQKKIISLRISAEAHIAVEKREGRERRDKKGREERGRDEGKKEGEKGSGEKSGEKGEEELGTCAGNRKPEKPQGVLNDRYRVCGSSHSRSDRPQSKLWKHKLHTGA